MKLLIVDEELPYPLDNGKKIRTFNLIRHLSGEMEIRYLSFGGQERDTQESVRALNSINVACDLVHLKLQRKSGLKFAWKLFANLFSKYPYIVTSHYKKTFLSRLEDLQNSYKPDLIMAEWTPYARYLDRFESVKKVVVAHNIESMIWNRYYENETNILKKAYIKIQARKIESFEKEVWRLMDGIITVSPVEKIQIERRATGIPVELVENGVDMDHFSPTEQLPEQGNIVFTGSMDWRPNQDAALFFLDEIFPLLRKQYEKLRFYIVGRNPPHFLRKRGTDDIIITGTVEDIRPYLRKAALVVVPLRIGGGSRLKILEAMAMRKPVVSTSVGAEGLEISDGENILLAQSPEDFAHECLRLLDDPDHSSRLGEKGLQLVKSRYRWEILADKMMNFLKDLGEARS